MPTPTRPNAATTDNTLLSDSGAGSIFVDGAAAEKVNRDRFSAQVLAHQDRVFRFILTLVPNVSDAEELLQQTLMTLWTTWERFDPAEDFFPWTCGIAHNHVRNYLRKKRLSTLSLSNDLLEQLAVERLQRDEVLEERRAALRQCLAKLAPEERALVERCYGAGATIKAAAEGTGRTANVVYKLLRRIRLELYQCITRSLGGDG